MIRGILVREEERAKTLLQSKLEHIVNRDYVINTKSNFSCIRIFMCFMRL
jgi:hypothetical protein